MDLDTSEINRAHIIEYIPVHQLAGDHIVEPHAGGPVERAAQDVLP